MRQVRITAIGLLTVVVLAGCSRMQDRRWGACAVGGGVLGALVGAGTAGGLVNGYEGGSGGSSEETGLAAGSGAVAGAALGALLGHMICDPVEAAPPPPPPPPPAPAPPAAKKLQLSADAYFDFDKSTLKPEGERRIDEFVRPAKDDPKVHILVEGHTDSVGSDAYNQRLSERRANAVKTYLTSQGVDAHRIETRGYGESKPIASNKTAEGRAKNRHVDITIQ
jgi:OOP family OmpA-OmpF porin